MNKRFIIFLCALFNLSIAWVLKGKQEPGLKVKWGFGPGASETHFFDVARNVTAAEAEGWELTERPEGDNLPGLSMYCPKDNFIFCTLYQSTGRVAGLQLALPVDNFTNYAAHPNYIGFRNWTASDNIDYYTISQFFVSEENLVVDTTDGEAVETLPEEAVWLTGLDGELIKVNASTGNDDLNTFKQKQNCFPTMGLHYTHSGLEDDEGSCERLMPWFTMIDSEGLTGTGFFIFGNLTVDETKRTWYEFPAQLVNREILPNVPDCVDRLGAVPGAVALHIFYISQPETISCVFDWID